VRFALTQPIVAEPGKTFVFSDIDPILAGGVLSYATKKTLLELADEMLFGPLGFAHAEWMGQDAAGIDNAAYALRLRPIDMQKLGLVYLQDGRYDGKEIVSKRWIREAFTPVVKSNDRTAFPTYGSYWRTQSFGPAVVHVAQGWKGQRIAVMRKQGLVVTMTGVIEPPADETMIFRLVMLDYILPSLAGHPDPAQRQALTDAIARVATLPLLPKTAESRMVPSASPKERHHGFVGN
jgi:CubicO group peptidase (beta-lactamase class C family)